MRLIAKIIDMESGKTIDRVTGESSDNFSVSLKLMSEQRQNSVKVLTLKDEHIKAGLALEFERLQGKWILLNVQFMKGDRGEIIWFFPSVRGDGVNPELFTQNMLAFDTDIKPVSAVVTSESDHKPLFKSPIQKNA